MGRVLTGSKAIFRLSGTKIAYASNVTYNENITLEPVNVLDKLEVEEHAETGYTCDLQCTVFRVANESVKQLGIMPRLKEILTQGVLTAEVIDRVSNATIMLMEGVKLQGRSQTVDARGVATETWSFVGRICSDEAGQ